MLSTRKVENYKNAWIMLTSWKYGAIHHYMKIAYIHNRPFEEGAAMGAERTFADWSKTNRMELVSMLEGGGLREGDTLLLRALSDLGRGNEATRHHRRIEGLGVIIEVKPASDAPRSSGRPERAEIASLEQYDHICALWYSAYPVDQAINRAAEIVGTSVDRQWVIYRCGKRDGTDANKKRAKMVKKFENKKEPKT